MSRRRSLRSGSLLAWLASIVVASALAAPAARAQLEQPLPPPPAPAPPRAAPRLTKPPAIKKAVDPVYPPEAFAAGLSGDVTLTLDLDAEGRVTKVVVARPAGQGFDEAAAAAAREMEFFPAEVDDKPSAIRIEYVIHFQPRVVSPPDGDAGDAGAPGAADGGVAGDAGAPPDGAPGPAAPAGPPPLVVIADIRERGTREPLAAADIAIIRRGTGPGGADPLAEVVGATDERGRAELRADLRNAPNGLRVIVSDMAHEPCIRDFSAAELGGAAPAAWRCFAAARDAGRYEARVRARSDHPEETRQTLSKAELMTVPGTVGDPLRVLQNLPGVARVPYGLGLLIVRGANPRDTGVFIGGQPIPILYHFLAGPSVFTAHLIEKIDFYPGGFGARYGRFSGGAVDVTIRGNVGKVVHGAADVNLRDSSAYIEGPLGGGWRASLALRRSYIDAILPLVVKPKIGSTFVTFAPVYWDYQGRVERDLPGGGRVAIVAYGSSDSLEVLAQDPTRNLTSDSHIGFHHVMGEWLTSFRGWTSRLSPTFGYSDQSFSTDTLDGFLRYQRLYLREDLTRRLAPWFTLATGFDAVFSYDWGDYNLPLPREGRTLGATVPEQTVVSRALWNAAPAVYVEGQWELPRGLRVVTGLRFDDYHVVGTQKMSLDPRLSARWAITPRLALKGSAGIFHQLPTPQYLDRQFGNPNLSLIWADQYQVGVERKLTDADDLSATLFYVRRHDMPVPSIDRFSSTGRGRAYGLELLLRHQVTEHFYGWIAYTLSRSEVGGTLAEGVPLGGGAGMGRNGTDLAWRLGPFDQTHNLIMVGSYRWRAYEAGLTFRYVTGTPTTPVAGSVYDADFNGYTRLNGARGSTRNPTFAQLDMRVERRWTFQTWVLGVYLDVINILNRENPEGTLYDYRYRQSAALRGLPILPILGVRGRF